MLSIEKIHPAVRLVSYAAIAIAIAIALGLTALGTVIGAQPAHAAELQTASVKVTLPGGSVITVPDGSSIDLSDKTAAAKKTTKKKTSTTAVKKANKAFKTMKAKGSKYGWTVKTTWTKKTAKKAVATREFAIPAKLQKQGKSLRMRVVQTTWHNAKGWHNTYKVDNKTYKSKMVIKTLKDYGKK